MDSLEKIRQISENFSVKEAGQWAGVNFLPLREYLHNWARAPIHDARTELIKLILSLYAERRKHENELRDALVDLMAEQNGPPLSMRKEKYRAAISRAEKILSEWDS